MASGSSLLRSVGVVGVATMLSRLLGLARDMVFAAFFDRRATDAFSIAFTIPNLLRRLLAEGILSTAFIPVFSGYLEHEELEQRQAYSAVLSLFSLVLAGVALAGIALAPWVVLLFAPGFEPAQYDLTAFLTRIMFPHIFLVGLTSFWVALLNTHKHFAAPALGPVLLNLGIIAGAVLLRFFFSEPITSMALGVLFGGLLQLLLQVAVLYRRGIRLGLRWQPGHPAIRRILALMGPVVLGLGVYQLNIMVSRALASLLPTGSVTYIYYSDRLMELPLGVIAVAFATVSLPTLAAQAEQQKMDDFKETLRFSLNGTLFVCIPAALGLLALREPIIALLFQRGKFHLQDTLRCAEIFIPAAISIIFVAGLRNTTPAFYALKDTKTPVIIAFTAFLLNVGLSLLFAFGVGLGAVGLTLSNSLSSLVAWGLSLLLLRRKLGPLELTATLSAAGRTFLAAAAMAAALWPFVSLPLWQKGALWLRLLSMTGLILGAALLFVLLAFILRIPQLSSLIRRLRRK